MVLLFKLSAVELMLRNALGLKVRISIYILQHIVNLHICQLVRIPNKILNVPIMASEFKQINDCIIHENRLQKSLKYYHRLFSYWLWYILNIGLCENTDVLIRIIIIQLLNRIVNNLN